MKKLCLIMSVLFICSSILFGEEKKQEEKKSALTWVQNMGIVRKALIDSNKIQELERVDKEILNQIKEKNISDCEKEAAQLIGYIIVSKNYYSTANTALGLEVLFSDFSDKNYFLDTVCEIASYDFMSNYLVLSTVLTGFRKSLGVDEDKLFKSYKIISANFSSYVCDQSKVGSIPVITSLILFLNDYFVLVEDGKLAGHYNSVAEDTFGILSSLLHGDLKKYQGGADLQKNFNFYANNRRERGAY